MHGLIPHNTYRYGFQGQERDDEVKGSGNSYDFGARMLDSRLGRWLKMDPLAGKYASMSPYNFVANSPLLLVDPNGEWIVRFRNNDDPSQGIVFEAEEGDNLVTLETQLGLKKGELSEAGNYFEYTFDTPKGSWLKLDRLQHVKEINSFLKENTNYKTNNCAITASEVSGIELDLTLKYEYDSETAKNATRWGMAVDQLSGKLADPEVKNINESEATIGDIITYEISYESRMQYVKRGLELKKLSLEDSRYSTEEEAAQYYYEYENKDGAAHFSTVLLKDKTGQKILQVFEKAGSTAPKISNYQSQKDGNKNTFVPSGKPVDKKTPVHQTNQTKNN